MHQKTYINNPSLYDTYKTARQFYTQIQKLCRPDSYNLFLHKHLGDVFNTICIKQEFEDTYNTQLHFIVRSRHEFIMKMYGITDYSVIDTNKYEKEVQDIKLPFICQVHNMSQVYNKTHNWDTLCKSLFQSIPIKGLPFITDCDMNEFCLFDKFWSYFGAYNLGLDIENIKHKLPKHSPVLSSAGTKALRKIAPLDKIVLIAPEASTAMEFDTEFWDIIAEYIHTQGYKIIVNSDRYTIKHGISTHKLKLSLPDVVALGLSCAYVFSVRSGLCDVLVEKREKLYAFYPAMLHREINSLNKCFEPTPNVNEIGIWKWKISPVLWEGKDLTPALQKYVDRIYYSHIKAKIKSSVLFFLKKHRKNYKLQCQRFKNLAYKGGVFLENNSDNIEYKYQNKHISFCGIPLYSCEYSDVKQNLPKVKYQYLGGVLQIKKSYETNSLRINLFGLQIFSVGKGKKKLFWINCPQPDFVKKWIDKIQLQIDSKYDDIYFFRHNIGETYVELMHLADVIKINKSKKPLLILWHKKNLGFYSMFLPQTMDMQFINISQDTVNTIFDKETIIKHKHQRFICSTTTITKKMNELLPTLPNTNFYDYINQEVGIKKGTPPASPQPSTRAINSVQRKIDYIELQDKFVILCPEATSLVTLNKAFWQVIVQGLLDKGYDIFVNSYDKNMMFDNTKTIPMTIEELLVLAKRSRGIITLGSGIAVFLTAANVKMDLIYTHFNTKTTGYTPDLVIKLYSVHHLPDVSEELVKEYNSDQISQDALIKTILERY